MKIKKSKRFLLIFIASLISFIIVYPLTYNALITKDGLINHSYKDFLLRYTKSPRLIIDSGSNSHYGINSIMLEKELGILTINLADNAAYPLREKLVRLEKYTHPGDIILLPLEWTFYLWNSDFYHHFANGSLSQLNFYYQEMPLSIKLDLIANSPFSSIFSALIKKINTTNPVSDEYVQLLDYKRKFNHYGRGDYQWKPLTSQNKEIQSTCDEHMFGHKIMLKTLLKNGFELSTVFKQNISLIKQLEHKGVHIMFTWPVVVGDNCYQGESYIKLKEFVIKIKAYLKQNNILMIGEPEDSLFKDKYRFDSYYHVIPIARDSRTKKLIAELKKSNAKAWFTLSHNINYSLSIATIDEYQLKMHFIESLNFIANRKIINSNSNNLFLASGWYPIEPWGVWSKDNESVLYVKLGNNLLQRSLQLTIENDLYKTHDNTTVLINDKKLGDYLLEGRKSIVIPSDYLTDKAGLVKIQFNHSNVKSPLEYGDNQDERKLKFALKSLQFTRLDN
jgi:hypothetical protein